MQMTNPSPCHLPQQRSLWQSAFGDTDAFLDSFFRTAYAPERCRCILDEDRVTSILYWIDCAMENQRFAYIYAVVTHPDYRSQGLCRTLMADTHTLLTRQGYAGSILVPQKESLRQMYAGMGYENLGGLREFRCTAAGSVSLHAIGPEEFAALRRNLLPANSVIQEGCGLAFLAEQLRFYAGEDFLLAAFSENGIIHGVELLGNTADAPGIAAALGCGEGVFRIPGLEKPFAMFHPLIPDVKWPDYFGFAFD